MSVLTAVGGVGGVGAAWRAWSTWRKDEADAREKSEARSEARTERLVTALAANTAAMSDGARAHDAQAAEQRRLGSSVDGLAAEQRRLAGVIDSLTTTPSGRITYVPTTTVAAPVTPAHGLPVGRAP